MGVNTLKNVKQCDMMEQSTEGDEKGPVLDGDVRGDPFEVNDKQPPTR